MGDAIVIAVPGHREVSLPRKYLRGPDVIEKKPIILDSLGADSEVVFNSGGRNEGLVRVEVIQKSEVGTIRPPPTEPFQEAAGNFARAAGFEGGPLLGIEVAEARIIIGTDCQRVFEKPFPGNGPAKQ